MLIDCLQAFQLLFILAILLCSCAHCGGEVRMTRELELSPRHGSDLVCAEYSLELANDKRMDAGISAAKATEDFGDGIFAESVEEDATSDHVQDAALFDYMYLRLVEWMLVYMIQFLRGHPEMAGEVQAPWDSAEATGSSL